MKSARLLALLKTFVVVFEADNLFCILDHLCMLTKKGLVVSTVNARLFMVQQFYDKVIVKFCCIVESH
jgi:hypothetical protein